MQISPTPPIKPFERLQITEGLLITRDRWRMTQAYHRQRQNFQFQSLYQPGIVCGLGVTITEGSETGGVNARNNRSLRIQPGIAIDAAGNPIVVPKPEQISITSTPLPNQVLVVHVVVSYVDPDKQKRLSDEETIKEDYRLAEKIALDELDVELCRITLAPERAAPERAAPKRAAPETSTSEPSNISSASDVYQPALNSLDHRYRQPVKLRPQKTVRVAHVETDDSYSQATEQGLTLLMQATDSLYPALQPAEALQTLSKQTWLPGSDLNRHDLLFCPHAQLPSLIESNAKIETLRNFLLQGSVLCISVDISTTRLDKLHASREELLLAAGNLDASSENMTYQGALRSEIEATETEIKRHVQTYCQPIFQLADNIGYPAQGSGRMSKTHPLLREPFLFAQPPSIGQQPTYVRCWGGIVLIISNLVNAWQLKDGLPLSRTTIRTTQEWGINLLHFAWRHHHLHQLQSAQRATPQER